jgi:hypothetical protein
MSQECPDCGASLSENQSCEAYFHQMLFWENEEPANGRVHHLMVLCYHLQHPALYSPEGLAYGRQLLKRFVVDGESPQNVRRQMKSQVGSNNRDWKIRASADSQGSYDHPISWRMNAADVVSGGIDNYCQNVEKWAAAIQEQLETMSSG